MPFHLKHGNPMMPIMTDSDKFFWVVAFGALTLIAADFTTYPILWGTVPTNSNSTAKNLSANCICDLQQSVCNTGCCCDSSCVPAVVSATSALGQCLRAGPPNQTLNWCVPNSQVQKVNLPSNSDFYSVQIQAAGNNFVDQLLCISSSSNPNLGDSYPDPPPGSGNGNDIPAVKNCPGATTVAMPTSYVYNTPVYISIMNGAKQPLELPYPVLSQQCNDQFQVGFMTSVPDGQLETFVSCFRSTWDDMYNLALMQGVCSSTPLSISTYANMSFYPNPSSGSTLPVTVTSIQFLDPVLGSLSTLPANSSTYYNSTVGYCRNLVYSVDMTIYYNWQSELDTGTISQISVNLIVTDAPNLTKWIHQQIRVLWTQYTADQPVLFAYSGNPGYLEGFPVLAGSLATQPNGTKQAMSRYRDGLPLPTAFNNDICSRSGQQPVAFGMNSTTNCVVPMNASQLAYYCNSADPAFWISTFLGDAYMAIRNQSLWLGVWGNSNTSNTNEWVQVVTPAGQNWPDKMDYSSTDQSCTGMIVGFDLKILTGVAFSSNNLQRKVLYANLCIRTATWTFPRNQNPNTTARFFMTSTVTYISKEQQQDTDVKKPAPPLLSNLPEDIFYPFLTSSALQREVSLVLMVMLLVFAGLVHCLLL